MDTNAGYFIADATHPLICSGPLWEELLICRIGSGQAVELLRSFEAISGKSIDPDSIIGELSGGQKVILMACLAVYSPARKIVFADLLHSLDADKYEAVLNLIESSGKTIRYEDKG